MSTTSDVASTITTARGSKSRIYIIAAVIVLAVFGGIYLFLTRGEVSTDDAQIDGRLVPVAPKIKAALCNLVWR